MSYCRWSTDNFNCDLYCYEDCSGGYTTHVAGNRQRIWVKLLSWLTDKRCDIGPYKIRMSRFDLWGLPHRLTHKKIRLLEVGETFNDATLESFYERIKSLIELGYKVPDYVLKTIEDEILLNKQVAE